jgi:hypothetical protein
VPVQGERRGRHSRLPAPAPLHPSEPWTKPPPWLGPRLLMCRVRDAISDVAICDFFGILQLSAEGGTPCSVRRCAPPLRPSEPVPAMVKEFPLITEFSNSQCMQQEAASPLQHTLVHCDTVYTNVLLKDLSLTTREGATGVGAASAPAAQRAFRASWRTRLASSGQLAPPCMKSI